MVKTTVTLAEPRRAETNRTALAKINGDHREQSSIPWRDRIQILTLGWRGEVKSINEGANGSERNLLLIRGRRFS
jgi:hypothetical protein